ncbi:hypothetical protein PSAC2689_50135 [Paraburkholderia sacchari]
MTCGLTPGKAHNSGKTRNKRLEERTFRHFMNSRNERGITYFHSNFYVPMQIRISSKEGWISRP